MSKGSSQCLQRKRNRPVCLYEGDCNNGWLCFLAKHLGSGLGLKGQLLLTQTMKCAIDEATYSIVNMTFGKKRIDKVDKDVLPFFIFKRRSNRTVIFINSPPMKKRNYRYIEKRNVMKEAERPRRCLGLLAVSRRQRTCQGCLCCVRPPVKLLYVLFVLCPSGGERGRDV